MSKRAILEYEAALLVNNAYIDDSESAVAKGWRVFKTIREGDDKSYMYDKQRIAISFMGTNTKMDGCSCRKDNVSC